MSSTKKELLSTLIFLVTNVVIIALSFLAMFLIENSSNVEYLGFKIMLYVILSIVIFQIKKRYETRLLSIIEFIVLLPLTLLGLFITVAIPVLSIQISIYLYLAISFILPVSLYRIDDYFSISGFNIETWIYIINTCGVVFAFIFHKQIRFLVYQVLPFTARKSEKMEKFKLVELNNYVLSENNIRFVIFLLYFLYIIVVNVISLEGNSFYKNSNIDKAVLQSFVTFVAFDRVIANLKINEFRPSYLLEHLRKSLIHVFEK